MIDLAAYDTDKSEAYLERYRQEFGHLFEAPIALLELGVQRGGSLYLWRDLLPKAQIAGLDLNEIPISDDAGRLHIYQGFQQDPIVLDRIGAEVAPDGFDVIVDDASHLGRYTRDSFWHLFEHHLKPGGIYVIDDWACAYSDKWADGHSYTGSRQAVGDFRGSRAATSSKVGRIESLRRLARSKARPIAAGLSPARREKLERLYMRAEGVSIKTRFKSHDYGMAGVIKQLVDATAINEIERASGTPHNGIDSVHVYESQVFVHKRN